MPYNYTDAKIEVIKKQIQEAMSCGYGGADIEIRMKDYERPIIRHYFEADCKRYIDWKTDNPYGKGIGRNMNGALCSGITIDFDGDTP